MNNKNLSIKTEEKKKLVQSELFAIKIYGSSGAFDVFGYTGGSSIKNRPIINAPPVVTNVYNGPVLGAGVDTHSSEIIRMHNNLQFIYVVSKLIIN